MSAVNTGFADWACDPQRSLEERFGAETLIEQTAGLWNQRHGVKAQPVNYTAEQLRRKARMLDPGYQPSYNRTDAERTEEVLPQLKSFDSGSFDDRPLRDLSFVRFCSGLEKFEMRHSEAMDWSPLLTQPTLTSLHVWGTAARDLRVIGRLTKLQSIYLFANAPWPDLSGLENLTELRQFNFRGNVLALRGIPCLPQVRDLQIHHGGGFNIPLRSVADLPEMPELRKLILENTDELAGIERYTQLLNLTVYGYYLDLSPLGQLQRLTHLTVNDGDYTTLAPLARMSQLRRVVIRNEEPPDFTPLADAPLLHEIVLEISPVIPVELKSLNALLPSWSEEFAAPEPRPLVPLKLRLNKDDEAEDADSEAVPRPWDAADAEMGCSEYVWFARRTNQRLTALLGKGWGAEKDIHRWAHTSMHVTIYRPEDIDRVPEIVHCLRQVLAATRHPFSYFFIVEPRKYYERDMEDIYEDDDEEFNAEREREDWESQKERQRERREYLERKYQYRLRQESGLPTTPGDFAPPKPPDEEESDTVAAGGVESEPSYDLATDLSLLCRLTEKACYIHEQELGAAEYYLGLKLEA